MDLGIASVASIVIIVYLIGQLVKAIPIDNKWIPIICGACGLILGLVGYAIHIPDFPANDWFTAAAVGIVSGFGATGVNQVYSQLKYKSGGSDSNAQ